MFMQFFIKASQYWQSISSRATTGNTLDSILYHLFCIFSFIFPSNVGKEKKNTWAMTQKNGAKSCPTCVPSNVHGRTHSYPFGSGLCIFVWSFLYFHMSCPLTKPTKWPVSPVKTQISLGICPVWSVFAICMKKHWAFNYLLSAQWRLWADPGWSCLRWVNISFFWFCHAAVHIIILCVLTAKTLARLRMSSPKLQPIAIVLLLLFALLTVFQP